ncbi:hypothetical protein D3C75_888020 [compost metagenome]
MQRHHQRQALQDHGEDQQGAGGALQALAGASDQRCDQQVGQAGEGQVQGVRLLQPGQGVGAQAGNDGQQQGGRARQEVDGFQYAQRFHLGNQQTQTIASGHDDGEAERDGARVFRSDRTARDRLGEQVRELPRRGGYLTVKAAGAQLRRAAERYWACGDVAGMRAVRGTGPAPRDCFRL